MTETPALTRKDFEARIVERAWGDEGFRARLKSDPRAAIADATGVTVPETVTIEVLEESPEQAYLVIPVNRVEIDEEQLEATSAGYGPAGPTVEF